MVTVKHAFFVRIRGSRHTDEPLCSMSLSVFIDFFLSLESLLTRRDVTCHSGSQRHVIIIIVRYQMSCLADLLRPQVPKDLSR